MDSMVRLTVVPDEGEAEIICGMLRAEGVRCAHVRTNAGSGGSDASATFGGWREVIVHQADLDRARTFLPTGDTTISGDG